MGSEEGSTAVSLFEPYERLVGISVRGRPVQVPENNTLLRCFQYVCPTTVPYGKFCWNDDCGHCELSYRCPGGTGEIRTRGCQLRVIEGMEVTVLSSYLKIALFPLLEPEA
jgi:hypothetical protein